MDNNYSKIKIELISFIPARKIVYITLPNKEDKIPTETASINNTKSDIS
jgi:hypothetical protein